MKILKETSNQFQSKLICIFLISIVNLFFLTFFKSLFRSKKQESSNEKIIYRLQSYQEAFSSLEAFQNNCSSADFGNHSDDPWFEAYSQRRMLLQAKLKHPVGNIKHYPQVTPMEGVEVDDATTYLLMQVPPKMTDRTYDILKQM